MRPQNVPQDGALTVHCVALESSSLYWFLPSLFHSHLRARLCLRPCFQGIEATTVGSGFVEWITPW